MGPGERDLRSSLNGVEQGSGVIFESKTKSVGVPGLRRGKSFTKREVNPSAACW